MHGLCAAGSDIMEGNKTLTLALVWQLMRAYTLALLSRLGSDTPVTEAEIVAWANNRAGLAIKNFQDKVHTYVAFATCMRYIFAYTVVRLCEKARS